jgi:predicted glycosyltransferase involved in capsule biosynthesis
VLPEAEIIVGDAPGDPFSKTCAVNAAFRKSTGDVLVMIDADCYVDAAVILSCASEIRLGRTRKPLEAVWFVPYRHLFRLTPESTLDLLASGPGDPFPFASPPDADEVGPWKGSAFGHWFGALIQMFPREAFELVQGMDPRFRGWGGEDVAFVIVLDTLFGSHRLSSNQVLTLWHSVHHSKTSRLWEGQLDTRQNGNLARRYRKAKHDRSAMQKIIDEWISDPLLAQYRIDY